MQLLYERLGEEVMIISTDIRTAIIAILLSIITAHVVTRIQLYKFLILIQEENDKLLSSLKDIFIKMIKSLNSKL